MANLGEQYWSARYKEGKTGWDIGSPSPLLKEIIDGLQDENISILIPGAGNGYEVEYAWDKGFQNVTVVDIAKEPLANIAHRLPNFPKNQLIHDDFFAHEGKYDLILEQTFFCALPPAMRDGYVGKMYDLLNESGKLTGLLFDFPLTIEGPPFGGSKEEYVERFRIFSKFFIEKTTTSIKERQGREFFFYAYK